MRSAWTIFKCILLTFLSTWSLMSYARPIIFVHGFSPFGLPENCKHDFKKMEAALASSGLTGPMVTVGYYSDDMDCDVKSSPKGSIFDHISDLSKDLAWYIYDQYSSKSTSIDVVAHSMGGLMARYALYRVAIGDKEFPPQLSIAHVATLGTPYTGYSWLAEACHVILPNIQCDDMFPLSKFIEELKQPQALVPQGQGGTVWNNIGSKADIFDGSDGFVTAASATSMAIPASSKTILPWYKLVFHTRYTNNGTVIKQVKAFLTDGRNKKAVTMPEDFVVPESLDEKTDLTLSRHEVFADFDQLSQEQKPGEIQPHFENGESKGIQFNNIIQGGLFAKMGIEDGDVVQGCTPETIDNPFGALTLAENTYNPFVLKFCITRNGSSITRAIRVE